MHLARPSYRPDVENDNLGAAVAHYLVDSPRSESYFCSSLNDNDVHTVLEVSGIGLSVNNVQIMHVALYEVLVWG